MVESLVYRTMQPGEERAVCDLVRQVFDARVAPDFAEEGVEEFYRFAESGAMQARIRSGGVVLVAVEADDLLGMLGFVPPNHVAMMFASLRGRGIGKALLKHAIGRVRAANPDVSTLTVHAARPAEPIYRKLGFWPVGPVTTKNGITYIPMELGLADAAAEK